MLVSGRLLIDHLAEDVTRDCETLLCLHDEFFLLGDLVDGSAWLQEEVVLVKYDRRGCLGPIAADARHRPLLQL